MSSPPPPADGAAPSAPAAGVMPWALILAAIVGSFAATSSGTTRAPFILVMAQDLAASIVAVANIVSMTAFAWGITSFAAGSLSDRFGRRAFLVGGPIALALCMIGVAQADGFLAVALWSTAAGACSGAFMGTVFAEVSLRAPASHRGRALSWVMSGQSLTLVVGVPLAAFLGAYIGWRGWHLCIGALAIAGALGLWASTRTPTRTAAGAPVAGRAAAPRRKFGGAVIALLSMSVAERICYGVVVIYYATFLQQEYRQPLAAVALPLLLMALGNIVGTFAGGAWADRTPDRLGVFGVTMLGAGAAGVALFGWRAGTEVSVALGFAYAFVNALGRPALMAALSETPEEVRGAVMGMSGAAASLGWIGAAALGGWMLGFGGFAGFGPLVAALAVVGAALAFWRRATIRRTR
jgi:DHA1 family inner membrane transport protein